MPVMAYTQDTTASPGYTSTDFGAPVTRVLIRTVVPVTVTGLVTNQILSFEFPYAPTQYAVDGLSDEYQQLARPGRIPLVEFASRRPVTLAFKVLVTGDTAKGYSSAESNANLLTMLARTKVDLVVVGLGPLISSLKYRMTEFSITSRRLNEQQQMTMFDATISLTQTVGVTPTVPGMVRIVETPISTTTGSGGTTTGGSGGSLWDEKGYYSATTFYLLDR